eukprot:Awhi_evm1s13047
MDAYTKKAQPEELIETGTMTTNLGVLEVDSDKCPADEARQPLISRRFARQQRCCWGGMARWLFYILLVSIITIIFLAIFIPVLLYCILPTVTQDTVNDSTIQGSNVQIQSYDIKQGAVETEHYNTYLPMFASQCNDTSLLDKETFLNTSVKDTLPCLLLGTGSSTAQMTGLIQLMMGNIMPNLSQMNWQQLFASMNINSCSSYSPSSVQAVLDISMTGVPSIFKGSISESYVDLYGPDDDVTKDQPWGRIAIPIMSLNNEVDGARLIEKLPVTIKVYDRMKFLMNNMNLLALQPITKGYTYWKQVGNLVVNLDLLGVDYHYSVGLNKNIKIDNATFLSGPFSVYNPDAQVEIDDPYSFLTCLGLDMFPSLMQEMTESSKSSSSSSSSPLSLLQRRGGDACQFASESPDETEFLACATKLIASFQTNAQAEIENVFKSSKTLKSFTSIGLDNIHEKIQNFISGGSPSTLLYRNGNKSAQENNAHDDYTNSNILTKKGRNRRDSSSSSSPSSSSFSALPYPFNLYENCNISATNNCAFTNMTISDLSAKSTEDNQKDGYLITPNDDSFVTRCIIDEANGTTIPYQFTVHPGSGENRTKMLLYYQGGGADWNELLNDFDVFHELTNMSLFEFSTATKKIVPFGSNGVFNRTNHANPFKTWTIVSLMYCSGDAFIGDHTQEPTPSIFSSLLKVKSRHRGGYNNTMAVLNWIIKQPEIASPESLAIMGCSAGALGKF